MVLRWPGWVVLQPVAFRLTRNDARPRCVKGAAQGDCKVKEGWKSKEDKNADFLTILNLKESRRYLLIIAHPDDETLFFTPLLAYLRSLPRAEVHVLCLTSGEAGTGHSRRVEELRLSLRDVFALAPPPLTVLDDAAFEDSMLAPWDMHKLAVAVKKVWIDFKPQHVFTFDQKGVSCHPNHICCFKVVEDLLVTDGEKLCEGEDFLAAYKLHTFPLHWKYFSVVTVVARICFSYACHIVLSLLYSSPSSRNESPKCGMKPAQQSKESTGNFYQTGDRFGILYLFGQFITFRGMKAHASQFVWYRLLFILFSTYPIYNEFSLI